LKPIKINTDLLTGTPEYQAQKQLSDLELDQQINNTIKVAIYSAEDKPPKKYTNAVTQEMIDEYKKEVMKPIDVNGKKFLYRSVDVPPIVKPVPTPFRGVERTEAEAMKLVEDAIDDITKFEAEVDRKVEKKRRLEDTYTRSTSGTVYDETARRAQLAKRTSKELDDEIKSMGLTLDKRIDKNKPLKIDKIVKNEMSSADVRAQIDQTELDIQSTLTQIKTKKDLIKQVQADYKLQMETEEENRLKEYQYENLQRQQNEELLKDFNRLNMGRTEIFKEPTETEDDFYLRLVAMGNVEADPVVIEQQIQTDILLKAKKNILQLTNEESKAETVIKMLNNDERFQMNKFFPKIKKLYSDSFGLNNKDIDADEMTQFIQNQLVSGQSLVSPPEDDEKDSISYKIRSWRAKKVGFLIDALNDDNEFLNLTRGTVKDIVDDLDSKNIYEVPEFLAIYNNVNKMDPSRIPDPVAKVGMKGLGLQNQVLPQTVIFGKIALDLNKLYYQNILSIKRHNGNKIIGHKNKRVSDNFVDIVFKMFDNKPVTQSDLKNIKDEQMIYDNLVVQSGLHKSNQIPTTIEQTSEQMKNRLGLLTGEIEAGNSNKTLLTELHELLFKMVRVHLISKTAATAYYKNIKDQFFTI